MGLLGCNWDYIIRVEIDYRMGLVQRDGKEYDEEDALEELESTAFRDKLDAGLCDELFEEFRSMESMSSWKPDRRMYTVMLAVAIMQSGAKISDDNIEHLRDIAPRIPDSVSPRLGNQHFNDPGRAQFLAALEHYKPGTRRSFFEPSCYHCGKIEADTGKFFTFCLTCMLATYCDQDCLNAHWEAHKPYCIAHFPKPRSRRSMPLQQRDDQENSV